MTARHPARHSIQCSPTAPEEGEQSESDGDRDQGWPQAICSNEASPSQEIKSPVQGPRPDTSVPAAKSMLSLPSYTFPNTWPLPVLLLYVLHRLPHLPRPVNPMCSMSLCGVLASCSLRILL